MNSKVKIRRLPAITVARSEYERLLNLANLLGKRDPQTAEQLADELDRARIVDDARMPRGIVRMGSIVEFSINDAAPQRAEIVFPKDADISRQRISVLTPVGAALLGLSAGQSIPWPGRDGRVRRLSVLIVRDAPAIPDAS